MDIMFADRLSPKDRLIVDLDVKTEDEVRKYVKMLHPYVGMFKIGSQLIHTVGGPQAVKIVHEEGGKVLYDCKLHDMTDTMQKSACSIVEMGVSLFSLHASAGIPAMKAVMQVCGESSVVGVTVLTSLKETDCFEIYNSRSEKKGIKFAHNMMNARVPYVICSPKESEMIKADDYLAHLWTIVEDVFPLWAVSDDQHDRIMTPTKALREAKSDYLVIGWPILQPPEEIGDPVTAAISIAMEIKEALEEMNKYK